MSGELVDCHALCGNSVTTFPITVLLYLINYSFDIWFLYDEIHRKIKNKTLIIEINIVFFFIKKCFFVIAL